MTSSSFAELGALAEVLINVTQMSDSLIMAEFSDKSRVIDSGCTHHMTPNRC